MLNDLKENNSQMVVGPARQKRILGFLLVFLVMMILVVVGLGLFLKKNKLNEKSKVVSLDSSSLNMAERTLVWLNGQKDDKGFYSAGLKCNVDSKCESLVSKDESGFSVLWAEYKYARKNNDENELKIFKDNLNLYANKEVIKTIDDSFWSCYFMWDIWKNYNLSQEIKDKLEKICFYNVYQSEMVNNSEVSNIQNLKENIDRIVSNLIVDETIANNQLGLNLATNEDLIEDNNKNQYFFSSLDNFSRYLWRKNDNDLLNGLVDFQKSLEDYRNGQTKVKPYEFCQTGIASFMLSNIFNNYKYYKLSTMILDQQIQKIDKNSIEDVSVCGLLADFLFKETKREKFKEKKFEIINDFLINNFDQKEGSFYSKIEADFIKKVKYNGLMVGILVD